MMICPYKSAPRTHKMDGGGIRSSLSISIDAYRAICIGKKNVTKSFNYQFFAGNTKITDRCDFVVRILEKNKIVSNFELKRTFLKIAKEKNTLVLYTEGSLHCIHNSLKYGVEEKYIGPDLKNIIATKQLFYDKMPIVPQNNHPITSATQVRSLLHMRSGSLNTM